LPKITLDRNFQKKREENSQKDIEHERIEKEKLQRENEEIKNKLSQSSTAPSPSNLQVKAKIIFF
jgi:hypothetical protein